MGEGCDDEPEEGKKGQEKTKEPPPVRSGTFKSPSQVHKNSNSFQGSLDNLQFNLLGCCGDWPHVTFSKPTITSMIRKTAQIGEGPGLDSQGGVTISCTAFPRSESMKKLLRRRL